MVFATGACRDRLVAALLDEARRRPPDIPPSLEAFEHYRRELGAEVYGAMGIAREDTAGHAAAALRKWEFFRAPLAGIICMHRSLGPADALSVGMFLQTLLLALTERGLGGCVEVSVTGYAEILRAQLAISEELSILCGAAIGYPDPDLPQTSCTSRVSRSRRTSCFRRSNGFRAVPRGSGVSPSPFVTVTR